VNHGRFPTAIEVLSAVVAAVGLSFALPGVACADGLAPLPFELIGSNARGMLVATALTMYAVGLGLAILARMARQSARVERRNAKDAQRRGDGPE